MKNKNLNLKRRQKKQDDRLKSNCINNHTKYKHIIYDIKAQVV